MKDPDLEIAWRHDLHVPPNDRTILERDVIVAPERNTKLCRVDPRSGTTMWEASIQSVWGWLAADRQRVVYLNQHSLLQCHDLGTGAKTWQLDLDGTFGYLFAHRGFVVTGGWRGYTPVTAIDQRRDLLATVELPDRLVAFGSTDGRFQVFNQDGWPIASCKLGKRITTPLTALEGGNVVCGTGGELVSVQINAHSPW